MAHGQSEVSIDRNPDDIWKLIREYGELADYMPGVESCTLDGDVRTLQMMGIVIKEQLRAIDDQNRRLTYSVVESPMTNMVSHEATIAIDPEGSGSHHSSLRDPSAGSTPRSRPGYPTSRSERSGRDREATTARRETPRRRRGLGRAPEPQRGRRSDTCAIARRSAGS